MRIPESLASLAEYGIIEEVVRPLMSGKEAQVYLVVSEGEERVAKIYKEAENRSFKHRADYTEGRKTRNSRDARAISKRSSHGRAQDEAAWRSTEVGMIYRLQAAGVRVPTPYQFVDGVLVMELVKGMDGLPAPRLGDLSLEGDEARIVYDQLIREVVRMLCAGVVHGDLSDFNVLMSADGPVLIDFPQSVDPAHNPNARKLLLRDVDNLHRFLAGAVRDSKRMPYAEEMWELYQQNRLAPETVLTGRYRPSEQRADTASVLRVIEDAKRDERRRREALGLKGGPKEEPHAPRTETRSAGAPQQSRRNESRAQHPVPQAPRNDGPPRGPQRPGARPPQARPPQARPPQARPPQPAGAVDGPPRSQEPWAQRQGLEPRPGTPPRPASEPRPPGAPARRSRRHRHRGNRDRPEMPRPPRPPDRS